MIEQVVSFLLKYKFVVLFYLIIAVFFYIKRKKLDFQAKIIILYRMRWGLKWMNKYAQKFKEWIILLGYIGVGAGYVGLIFISYILVKNLFDLATSPTAVSGVSLVLPGINVPGLGVLPFWYWILAIFIIALVHEFSHGIVARAHNIQVKNTGVVLFGPIIGAFVEPNEQKLRKESDIKQYSVLAAGSFSNILLAVVAILLLNLAFFPLQQSMVEPTGFTFDAYFTENSPFEQSAIPTGTIITGINNLQTLGFEQFNEELVRTRPGDKIMVTTTDGSYPITLGDNPDNPGTSLLGIKDVHNEFELKDKYSTGVFSWIYYALDWFSGFLRWLFILSLGIGLFNLLPLPIVDGGRMAQVFLHKWKGSIVGEKRYRQVSLFFLVVLLLNLFWPLIGKLF